MIANDSISKDEVRDIYRKRAKRYDFTANLYYLIGFREWAYRRQAVRAMALRPGATVVEIGCGTGLNFPLLQEAVGPTGRIIGVDLTDAMLQQARQRVIEQGWTNVDLVLSDAASFPFPDGVDGILSTFALTLAPEYDQVIQRGSEALAAGGRWVILDFKLPDTWLAKLAPPLAFLTAPFGVRLEMASRHPWESIARYLPRFWLTELYGGFAYIAIGEQETEEHVVRVPDLPHR
ncbi:MAG: class I SAM-dependent methyltransferase [Caldilineaceae bacterium]|nr:class I SAM-dependent methyltransferase [Caldilineaceae bacterium]